MAEPRPDRPQMPTDYGVPETTDNLLPWSHARERLERARIYWIATMRPDGRPHVTPTWAVWLDDVLYFDGSPETRRMRNIAQNPMIAVHLEGDEGKDVVIVEGRVRDVRAPERSFTKRLAAEYSAKYAVDNYKPEPTTWDNGGLYVMQPTVALAWRELREATRWHFDNNVTT